MLWQKKDRNKNKNLIKLNETIFCYIRNFDNCHWNFILYHKKCKAKRFFWLVFYFIYVYGSLTERFETDSRIVRNNK